MDKCSDTPLDDTTWRGHAGVVQLLKNKAAELVTHYLNRGNEYVQSILCLKIVKRQREVRVFNRVMPDPEREGGGSRMMPRSCCRRIWV